MTSAPRASRTARPRQRRVLGGRAQRPRGAAVDRRDRDAPGRVAQGVAHVGDERPVVGVGRPGPHVAEAQDPQGAGHVTGTGSGRTGCGASTATGRVPARATAAPAIDPGEGVLEEGRVEEAVHEDAGQHRAERPARPADVALLLGAAHHRPPGAGDEEDEEGEADDPRLAQHRDRGVVGDDDAHALLLQGGEGLLEAASRSRRGPTPSHRVVAPDLEAALHQVEAALADPLQAVAAGDRPPDVAVGRRSRSRRARSAAPPSRWPS